MQENSNIRSIRLDPVGDATRTVYVPCRQFHITISTVFAEAVAPGAAQTQLFRPSFRQPRLVNCSPYLDVLDVQQGQSNLVLSAYHLAPTRPIIH